MADTITQARDRLGSQSCTMKPARWSARLAASTKGVLGAHAGAAASEPHAASVKSSF